MSYADKTLTCRGCGSTFVFTAGEQEFYAEKGFVNEPGRCYGCRQERKAAIQSRNSAPNMMRDAYAPRDPYGFRANAFSGARVGSGYGNYGGYGPRDTYRTPAYGQRNSFTNPRESYAARMRPDSAPRALHTTVCAECGGEAHVPFIPRGDKPVLCIACFRPQRRTVALAEATP